MSRFLAYDHVIALFLSFEELRPDGIAFCESEAPFAVGGGEVPGRERCGFRR